MQLESMVCPCHLPLRKETSPWHRLWQQEVAYPVWGSVPQSVEGEYWPRHWVTFYNETSWSFVQAREARRVARFYHGSGEFVGMCM